jgi:hypothetical protein
MSPTQAGRFLALGETIVRTHLNLLTFYPSPIQQFHANRLLCIVRYVPISFVLLPLPPFVSTSLLPRLAYWVIADIAAALGRDDNPLAHALDRTHRSFLDLVLDRLDTCDAGETCLDLVRCVYVALHPHPSLLVLPPSPLPRSAGLG